MYMYVLLMYMYFYNDLPSVIVQVWKNCLNKKISSRNAQKDWNKLLKSNIMHSHIIVPILFCVVQMDK